MNEFLQKEDCSSHFAAALTVGVLNMIIEEMRPLSVVEDEGFHAMVKTFQPGYILPKSTCFTDIVEKKYEDEFQKVKLTLSSSSSMLCLTTDAWTGIATDTYLAITSHFINNNWELLRYNLTTMPLEEQHTAVNIVSWIETAIEKF